MSEEHREQADAVERELDDMEDRADTLEEETEAAKADWERKREDDSVPGAPPSED
jgi:septal ring factor EnvC (AmiA/AmiB activator)